MAKRTSGVEKPSNARQYRARDLKRAAGLTYRQVHDWDSKGALPSDREGAAGWRKFSFREVFAIAVCAEIREKFGVPLESMSGLNSFMLQKGADHFAWAINMIGQYGLTVYLLTDLEKTFIMDSDLDIEDLFRYGSFRGDAPAGYILIKLNPIVNLLLECLDPPVELKTSDRIYRHVELGRRAMAVQSQEELEVLRLIRQKEYQRVTVHLKDGTIIQADAEEEIPGASVENLEEILQSRDYQTVSITKHDGVILRVKRKTPVKFSSGQASKPPSRQKDPEARRGS